MKTRLGFVSNSSSSSCLIIGRVAGTIRTLEKLEEGKRYVVNTWHWLDEGKDVIELNQEMLDWMKKNWKYKSDKVIEVEHLLEDGDGDPLPAIPEGLLYWLTERSYHYTDCIETLVDRYQDGY